MKEAEWPIGCLLGTVHTLRALTYYQSKRYCPVLVAQEGSALWGITLTIALLHDQNRTIPFGLFKESRRRQILNRLISS